MNVGKSEQQTRFDRDGYTVYDAVLDADLVSEASAHVDWLSARNPD